jgi:hypothetical protein
VKKERMEISRERMVEGLRRLGNEGVIVVARRKELGEEMSREKRGLIISLLALTKY